MKKTLFTMLCGLLCLSTVTLHAQDDKSKRPSPPASVTQQLGNGAVINIEWGQPSVKGRTIGKDLEPFAGKIWRTGANEATTFSTNKEIKIGGKTLPMGKYALFTIAGEKEWTVILNNKADQWGAYEYDEKQDALRTSATVTETKNFSEKLQFTISAKGEVNILWGQYQVSFTIE